MDAALHECLSRTYAQHPLTAANILARIRRQRGVLDGINELNLAIDSETGITDQNHPGGIAMVKQIAEVCALRGDERILDVGSGLGGTSRVLAHYYRCHCHGLELTVTRYRDAVELTQLVHLDKLVTFTCGEFLTTDIPGSPYDLVIMQASLMHFPDPTAAMRRCTEVLRRGGRLLIEDGYLGHNAASRQGDVRLNLLWESWNGRFQEISHWLECVTNSGFTIERTQDLSDIIGRDFQDQIHIAASPLRPPITRQELRGVELAADLFASKAIGYMRILARKERTA